MFKCLLFERGGNFFCLVVHCVKLLNVCCLYIGKKIYMFIHYVKIINCLLLVRYLRFFKCLLFVHCEIFLNVYTLG